jgi:hypothetical protein
MLGLLEWLSANECPDDEVKPIGALGEQVIKRETLELVRAYYKIREVRVRSECGSRICAVPPPS